MAFGPYDDEEHAQDDVNNVFERKHPNLDWLVLEVDGDYADAIREPIRHQGWRTVQGTYEKNLDTGEVREKPCYETVSDFPG